MRHTKIVCTIGPASESKAVLEQLMAAGMNVARLNLSHGSLAEHEQRIKNIREVSAEMGKTVGILLDIQGPKIRIGDIPEKKRIITEGQTIVFSSDPECQEPDSVYLGQQDVIDVLTAGTTVFLDDGLLELIVSGVAPGRIECKVVVGGVLTSRKGISLPGVKVDLPPITADDRDHIRFGVEQGVDFVAASFVRRAEHVRTVKDLITELGGDQVVIAKIENAEGVANMDEIIAAADGVMVARGDMGVEMPPEDVPIVQKRLIAQCNYHGKPVITATQMLDSMVRNPRPTRAEVTDVANAIFEGTDAVMLSGETAVGQYPARVVRVMDRIARRTEEVADFSAHLERLSTMSGTSVAEAMARATTDAAEFLQVPAIISITRSGATARLISKYKPKMPTIAVTPNERVARQLTLNRGVVPFAVPRSDDVEKMVDTAMCTAAASNLVQAGDTVAIVAGVRATKPGSTNSLQVQTVSLQRRGE